jgi:1-acylglycerone phosphate reductase
MALESVLITGCSSGGIGSSLALAFHASGLHVFATARDVSKLEHLAHLPNITILPLDVTSVPSISAAVEVVKKTNDGKLKYLVNNSGRGMVMPLLDVDIEEAKKLYDVNLWGPLIVTKAFAELIVENKGTVVLVGSSAGVMGFAWTGKCIFHLISSSPHLYYSFTTLRNITNNTGRNLQRLQSLPQPPRLHPSSRTRTTRRKSGN